MGQRKPSGFFFEKVGGEFWVAAKGCSCNSMVSDRYQTKIGNSLFKSFKFKCAKNLQNPKIDFVGAPPRSTQQFAPGELITVPVPHTVDTQIVTWFNKK